MDTTRTDPQKQTDDPDSQRNSSSTIIMQLLEFAGSLTTAAAVVIAVILIFFLVAGFDSDINRQFLTNTFRQDYTARPDQYTPNGSQTSVWTLPPDATPSKKPVFETLIDIYTTDLLGAFHWGLLLVIGLWLLCSIGVFTLYVMNDVGTSISSTGKPNDTWARAGPFFSWVAFIWNMVAFAFIFSVTWRLFTGSSNPQDTNKVPMTTQTFLATTMFSFIAFFYFMREIMERYSGDEQPTKSEGQVAPSQASRAYVQRGKYTFIGYHIKAPSTGAKVVSRRQYTPILCITWADGWTFSDALLLTGVIGASQNVVTHEIASVYLAVIYACFTHSALVRLLLDAYINEVPDEKWGPEYGSIYEQNKFRAYRARGTNGLQNSQTGDEKDLFHVRVMSFLANFAGAFLAVGASYILFLRYSHMTLFAGPYITAYIVLSLVAPVAGWLLGNLWMEVTSQHFLSFRTSCLIEFILGLLVRLIFVAILLWSLTPQLRDSNADLDLYMFMWTGKHST